MNKKIVYLVQTSDYIPDYVKVLEDMGRDVYILSYKEPVKHENSIFFPNSTFATGRNKLAGIVPKDYLYYVFLDDDVNLLVREERYPEDEGKNPWKIFDDFLLEYEPAIGTAYCGRGTSNSPMLTYLSDEETNTLKEFEVIIMAIHKDIMNICFPMYTGFDDSSWFWTCTSHLLFMAAISKSSLLQCNKLLLLNKFHRGETSQHIRSNKLLYDICKKSLLCQEDKDNAYVLWVNREPAGEYEKPYPGKYKKMAEDFKNRIDKNHVIWKDHPFINE